MLLGEQCYRMDSYDFSVVRKAPVALEGQTSVVREGSQRTRVGRVLFAPQRAVVLRRHGSKGAEEVSVPSKTARATLYSQRQASEGKAQSRSGGEADSLPLTIHTQWIHESGVVAAYDGGPSSTVGA